MGALGVAWGDLRDHAVVLARIQAALDSDPASDVVELGDATLPSVFDVSGLASACIGAAAAEVAELIGTSDDVTVDRGLASSWFSFTARPIDFELPPLWGGIAGDYETADGWIRLHTYMPHHRERAVEVLGGVEDRDELAKAARRWSGDELETAIVEAGGCAAVMRTVAEWSEHPQGAAVGVEPLIAWSGEPRRWSGGGPRPLHGLKVLDLTRILAGPVATRFLAGWGADVLRIDPPDWSEALLEPEVTLGKRCARLDLRRAAGVDTLRTLLAEADVVVHGYRPGALDGLGLTPFDDVIDVALDAYGWTGPWSRRRGFDSLVQMSCGIAHAGMAQYDAPEPKPLPTQALDHGAGYLIAAAVIRALRGGPSVARLSLARTAELLISTSGDPDAAFDFEGESTVESNAWGSLRRLVPPVSIGTGTMTFDRPATPLGTHNPAW